MESENKQEIINENEEKKRCERNHSSLYDLLRKLKEGKLYIYVIDFNTYTTLHYPYLTDLYPQFW